ncbi:MAG TPA: MoaD/ThiS family protein [Ghiorsea sp.]|nr:MoaD/ThiS family protein [Ghiorsea sp.]HIP06983.1 MoaD/ThiS family protein [Mariprofundaceae bacterium]
MIKILFFGMIADKVGKQSTTLQGDMSLGDVIAAVGCADIRPLLVAVNEEQVKDLSLILKDGDEVALMPPFSGG